MNLRSDKIAQISILLAIGIVLGYIENIINIVPVGGVKIGLSNIVILYGIYRLGLVDSLLLTTLKSIVVGLLFSSVMSILYSLPSGILSLLVMYTLKNKINNEKISIYGISVAGSCTFNIMQFIVASFVLSNFVVIINLWYVLPMSVVTGYLMAEVFKNIFLKD